MIRRLFKPLRRPMAILLIAAVLTLQPVKAHAFVQAVLVAAVTYVAQELLSVFTGDGTLKGMLLVLETQLPIVLSTIDMKINENIAKAGAAAHKEQLQHEQYRASAREHPADILQANCQAMTGLADTNAATARSTNVYQRLLLGEQQHLENRGSGLAAGGSAYQRDRSLSTEPLRQITEEYDNHCSRYATENDLAAAIAAKCKKPDGTPITTLADIRSNPYRGAETNAQTLLATQSFNEDRHYLAAADFCYTLTGNQPLNYAQGRALSEDLSNIKQFLVALSDKSARDLSYYSCMGMIARRLPLDSNFAKNDPKLGKLIASQTADAPGSRTAADISKAATSYLIAGEGYTQVDASPKVTGEAASGGQQQLINGQLVSLQQNDEAIYVARFMAPEFANKVKGVQGLLVSRVANLQIMWRQYQELERQVLTDAIELARMVRTAPGYGGPPASSAAR